jgi:metal-responsive CopG/Arc/MetJ family transcriptional regulator
MFGGPKVKLEKELYEKLKKFADAAGYSSLDEFVNHILERELQAMDTGGDQDPEKMREKLRGLGYIS